MQERAQIFGYLAPPGPSLGRVVGKIGSSLTGLGNSSSFSRAKIILLSLEPCRACQKAYGLGQDLGPGSIGYWAYLL